MQGSRGFAYRIRSKNVRAALIVNCKCREDHLKGTNVTKQLGQLKILYIDPT
jgi:hypothetical protein